MKSRSFLFRERTTVTKGQYPASLGAHCTSRASSEIPRGLPRGTFISSTPLLQHCAPQACGRISCGRRRYIKTSWLYAKTQSLLEERLHYFDETRSPCAHRPVMKITPIKMRAPGMSINVCPQEIGTGPMERIIYIAAAVPVPPPTRQSPANCLTL